MNLSRQEESVETPGEQAFVLSVGHLDENVRWLGEYLDGVKVVSVADGREAIGVLSQRRWSLLVLEGSLSKPSAEEVLRHARQRAELAGMPVIACLLPEQARAQREALERHRGVIWFLLHPHDREALARRAAALMNRPLSSQRGDHGALSPTLQRMRDRYRGELLRRLDLLEAGLADLVRGTLEEEQRRSLLMEAHTLRGSASMYGFTEGARLAREIDRAFLPGPRNPDALARIGALSRLVGSLREAIAPESPLSSNG